MSQPADVVTGQVTGLASGGQGIIRQDGFVVFVPFTAPGETVSCRITEKKKTYANAELLKVLQPSPNRAVPPCRYYGTCGGCQLQHIDYATQLEYKRQSVEDALKRIGKLPIESVPAVVASQDQWAYRRHITLTVRPRGSFFEAGYITTDNKSLLPVEHCPIFVEERVAIIENVQKLVSRLHSIPDNGGKVGVMKQGNGKYVLHFTFKTLPSNSEEVFEKAIAHYPQIAGIVASSMQEALTYGKTTAMCEVDGLKFTFSPQSFVQTHPEQSCNIYRQLCDIATRVQAHNILDLYSGVGISSILLAKQGAHVLGVESNAVAVQLSRDNAARNSVEHVQFLRADVEDVVRGLMKQQAPDLVIANPPRTGLDSRVIHALLQKLPKHIVYISCMPSTLARDLNLLCEKHYRLESCQPYDMFPQTSHVETVVHIIQQ